MKTIFCFILTLFGFGILKIQAQKNEAADEILFKIVKAGNSVKNNTPLNQDDVRQIVCLTNLTTKKWDGNYFGAFYFPSTMEIEQWKEWIVNNGNKISYSSEIIKNEKIIQVEYEEGKFRKVNCY